VVKRTPLIVKLTRALPGLLATLTPAGTRLYNCITDTLSCFVSLQRNFNHMIHPEDGRCIFVRN